MSKYDVNTLITSDSTKYNKDCKDFCCLQDGLMGDYKYCNFSKLCRQVDFDVDGKAISMESHYCPVVDPKTNEVVEWDYYCTGKHDLRCHAEKTEGDDKAS